MLEAGHPGPERRGARCTLAGLNDQCVDFGILDDEGVSVLRGHRMQRRITQAHHHRSRYRGPGFGAVARQNRQRTALAEADGAKQADEASDRLAEFAIAPANLPVSDCWLLAEPRDCTDDKAADGSPGMKLAHNTLPLCLLARGLTN